MIHRRGLITGLAATLALPSIVRADSLMKIVGDRYFLWQYERPILPPLDVFGEKGLPTNWKDEYIGPNGHIYMGKWTFFGKRRNIYADKVVDFIKEEMTYPRSSKLPPITALTS